MTDKLKVQQLKEYKHFIIKDNCIMIPVPDFDMLIDLAEKATQIQGIDTNFSINNTLYEVKNGIIIKSTYLPD